MVLVAELTRFAEWLDAELAKRGITKSQFARYEPVLPTQTVYSWFNDGRTPKPEQCRLIAQKLRVPYETVLIKAGHLSAADMEEPRPEPDLPEWSSLIGVLTPGDLAVVERLVRSLAERPAHPPHEEPSRGQPPTTE